MADPGQTELSNRVGSEGLFPSLSSHTTVRTGRVYGGLIKVIYLFIRFR